MPTPIERRIAHGYTDFLEYPEGKRCRLADNLSAFLMSDVAKRREKKSRAVFQDSVFPESEYNVLENQTAPAQPIIQAGAYLSGRP